MAAYGDMADRPEPLSEYECRRVDRLIASMANHPKFEDERHPLKPDRAEFESEIQGRLIDRLDRYREAAGLKKGELASYLGADEKTIRLWRANAHSACSMSAESCETIVRRLFTSRDWLRYGLDHIPDGDEWDPSMVQWFYMLADADTKADVCHALRRGLEMRRLARELDNMREGLDPLIHELLGYRQAANT